VAHTHLSAGPSAVVCNDRVYVFHQGAGLNQELWYSIFDGENWTDNMKVEGVGMSSSPSAVLYNGGIFVFHQGGARNGKLWVNTLDANGWGW
jgi:hypothetical protein